jgi:hypothetical protein
MTGVAPVSHIPARKSGTDVFAAAGEVAGALDDESIATAPTVLNGLAVPVAREVYLKQYRGIALIGRSDLTLEPAICADDTALMYERGLIDHGSASPESKSRRRDPLTSQRRAASYRISNGDFCLSAFGPSRRWNGGAASCNRESNPKPHDHVPSISKKILDRDMEITHSAKA